MSRPPTFRSTTNSGVALALCAAFALAGCGGSASRPIPYAAPQVRGPSSPSPSKIQHVVIIVQENRSFDNLFADFPHADGATYGLNSKGKKVPLAKRPLFEHYDIPHGHAAFSIEYDNRKMDGFDKVLIGNPPMPAGNYPYQYADPATIAPYWAMAKRYVLADEMFQTQTSGSYTAHQDLIAGGTAVTSDASVIDVPTGVPWGCDAPNGTVTSLMTNQGQYEANAGPFPCFTYATLRDSLDNAGLSWRFYTPAVVVGTGGAWWSSFDSIHAVRYGPEWHKNVISPAPAILTDLKNGSLANVTWVIPDSPYSDHAGGAH
ncbi:MAG: hypothetical protein JO359_08750, partial [Candidatus Eremiobacteraeota bacterium]|nr:hypothetical protein [Candidatus Eremiobacteraeota bacterium]